MDLSSREWKEFKIIDIFGASINAKPYHMNNLKVSNNVTNIVPYITRTNSNNGFQCIVEKKDTLSINPKHSICFGAENATYFYQDLDYITGNKMYYYKNDLISGQALQFLTSCLNKSILNCGFGYGMGLTGRRSDTRVVLLPSNKYGEPDYEFMEQYINELKKKKLKEYIEYAKDKLKDIKYKEIEPLENKEWKEFFIEEIFNVFSGKRLTKQDMRKGNIPFISSSDSNNGITNFISNENNSLDNNVLGVNYNGSVVENFYHKYKSIFSDDVKRFHLKNYNDNESILLFFKSIILKQKDKYSYGYKFNETRMLRQYVMLPINKSGKPDYEYMEQYIKNLMYKKYNDYLEYVNKKAV